MQGRASKNKGSGYERELAAYLNEAVGLTSRRALLSGGGRNEGGADLDGTPFIHVEAKRTEKFTPYAAISQAEDALAKSKDKAMPVVISRRSNMKTGDSLTVLRLDDFLRLYSVYLRAQEREATSFSASLSRSQPENSSSNDSTLSFMRSA